MIPFGDLKAQYHSIKAEIDTAIAAVLESSQFALGPEVAGFEQEFAAYCANREAVQSAPTFLLYSILGQSVRCPNPIRPFGPNESWARVPHYRGWR
jgi:hypothetical protein